MGGGGMVVLVVLVVVVGGTEIGMGGVGMGIGIDRI